ncbi:hypothetical protein VLK31_10730 [Variovorax sp. H27-G14]
MLANFIIGVSLESAAGSVSIVAKSYLRWPVRTIDLADVLT